MEEEMSKSPELYQLNQDDYNNFGLDPSMMEGDMDLSINPFYHANSMML